MRSPFRASAACLAVGLVLADSSIAVLALPAIYRELELELGDLHWALTSFNLALALAAVPAALLARRVGARAAFGGGLVLFAVASAACALAPGYWSLVGFRAVQALGGAAVVVAALELLGTLVGSRGRAVSVWVAAGAVGAAVGPAVGGALTEAVSWRAVFAVQAPLALAALPLVRGGPSVSVTRGGSRRVNAGANVALGLVSAGLAAALFLVVLLLIEGWGLSPVAAAAVVTVLPLAALATARVAHRVESGRARAAAGVLLCAGGLAALGVLPEHGWAWTVPPQLLLGAGLALAFAGLTDAALRGREPQALQAGVTVAARHAGIVAGLLLLTPVLVAELDRRAEQAELAGAAQLLDADIAPGTKLRLAARLADRLGESSRGVPDLDPAFDAVRPQAGDRAAFGGLRRTLDDTVAEAVTVAFSRPFLLAAALALAALAALAVRERPPA
jgi:MFS family permease